MARDSVSTLLIEYLRARQELVDTLVVDGLALPMLRGWAVKAKQKKQATRPPPQPSKRIVRKRSSPPMPAAPLKTSLVQTISAFALEREEPVPKRGDPLVQQALERSCQGLKLLESPPDDALARQRSAACAIVVLSVHGPVVHVALLRSLVRALQTCVASTRFVELSEERLSDYKETLKMTVPKLVACSPAVAKFLQGSEIALHVIEDLGQVIKRPRLKAALWNSLLASWNKT